jgi:MFS family permease
MLPVFLVFAVCAFASGFALRIIDPLVIPIAHHFAVPPAAAALLSTAYALPYALAQPFLGPLGDRFGKARCVQVCIAGLAGSLGVSTLAPTFELLLATRVAAGIFAGGLIPLVLAGLGDAYEMSERQVMIGRMLVAIITGQMLGSTLAGLASDAYGWRSGLGIAAVAALLAAGLAWTAMPRPRRPAARRGRRASLVCGAVRPRLREPEGGLALCRGGRGRRIDLRRVPVHRAAPDRTHRQQHRERAEPCRLGAWRVRIGGLAYALSVRGVIALLGVRRMCIVGAVAAAASYAALAFFPLWWLDALALMIAGVSYYMLHNSLQTEATEIAPSARGSAVALFACGLFAGQGIGPLVFGALVHAAGFATALLASGMGILLLGWLVVRKIISMESVRDAPR